MKFGDEIDSRSENPAPAPESGMAQEGAFGQIFRLLKRDYRLWLLAVWHNWILLAALPLSCGLVVWLAVTLFVPFRFEATCSLFRHELQSMRRSGIPEEYRPVQLSVILNMLKSRGNLATTIERLNLNMTPGQLFGMVEVRLPERNANYIYVSATSKSPEISAEIANTLSEVFIDDYKQLIRRNLAEILVTIERSRKGLVNEIDALAAQLHEMCTRYNVLSIDDELNKISGQVVHIEGLLQSETAHSNSLEHEIENLRKELDKTPTNVLLFEEANTERQNALERERVALAQMRQRYTDRNPVVQKQIEIVNTMEQELKKGGDSAPKTKVVTGQNPVYVNLNTELAKMTVELVGARSRVEEYKSNLKQLQEQRIKLNQIRPEFLAASDLIDQKKRLLNTIEDTKKSLEMFLERSYSDVMIYEPATPMTGAQPRHRAGLTLMGGFLGLLVALGIILVREGLNFRIRSRVDVEEALRLEPLGMIPELCSEERVLFYSSMQQAVVNLERKLAMTHPALLMVAPLCAGDFDEGLQRDFLELLAVRNIRTLVVKSVSTLEGEAIRHLLNDYLYGLCEQPPLPDKDGNFYFMLDDMAFLAPPPCARILALKDKLSECDWLIWDLFHYGEDAQLFVQLCGLADLTLMPCRFDVSDKSRMSPGLKDLRENGVKNMCAILYGVKPKYFFLVT